MQKLQLRYRGVQFCIDKPSFAAPAMLFLSIRESHGSISSQSTSISETRFALKGVFNSLWRGEEEQAIDLNKRRSAMVWMLKRCYIYVCLCVCVKKHVALRFALHMRGTRQIFVAKKDEQNRNHNMGSWNRPLSLSAGHIFWGKVVIWELFHWFKWSRPESENTLKEQSMVMEKLYH